MKIRSEKTKISFINYLNKHPGERFWQALENWCGKDIELSGEDPYYFEEKNK